jgi:CheY-like chemotaxis protein
MATGLKTTPMTDMKTSLEGLQILVVEDEVLVAMDIEDMLLDLKCEPVGPASTIKTALEIVRSAVKLDGVLLDMNLHGQTVLPVVEELISRGVPFLLVTGYARRDEDPSAMRDAPRLNKPFAVKTLSKAMTSTFLNPN